MRTRIILGMVTLGSGELAVGLDGFVALLRKHSRQHFPKNSETIRHFDLIVDDCADFAKERYEDHRRENAVRKKERKRKGN